GCSPPTVAAARPWARSSARSRPPSPPARRGRGRLLLLRAALRRPSSQVARLHLASARRTFGRPAPRGPLSCGRALPDVGELGSHLGLGAGLELADPLARDAEGPAELLQGRALAAQVAALDDGALARVEPREGLPDPLAREVGELVLHGGRLG